jgi:tRNA U34 5-methylaminomethyl-2-thiouridine-forming methyltransferase MnmC
MTEYVTTGDGSITLTDSETGDLYHNRAGAFSEAFQNYVEPSNALATLQERGQVTVLDVCFGLGYNTLVLLQKAVEAKAKGFLEVVAIESDPNVVLSTSDVMRLEKFDKLREFFGCNNFASKFSQRSMTFGGLQISIDLRQADARQAVPALARPFDVVFHDPFSPRKVPELWTLELFHEYRRLLQTRQGVILTYSSKAAVRNGLRQAGFIVYKTTSLGEKKGGTMASVGTLANLPVGAAYLSDDDSAKLDAKTGTPYRDEAFSRSRQDISNAREAELAT